MLTLWYEADEMKLLGLEIKFVELAQQIFQLISILYLLNLSFHAKLEQHRAITVSPEYTIITAANSDSNYSPTSNSGIINGFGSGFLYVSITLRDRKLA